MCYANIRIECTPKLYLGREKDWKKKRAQTGSGQELSRLLRVNLVEYNLPGNMILLIADEWSVFCYE